MPSPLEPFLDGSAARARFSVRPPPLRRLDPVEGLLAGAAEADITPPPGLPKAGYSRNARDGNGFRSRLHARVLHLRSGTASIAIVHCDLLGGSAVLQHLVANAIAERTDIPLAGLMIGATHTHAGPGQFLGTDFYNRFASNRPGFDPAWAAFLVEQISDAVLRAHDARVPARIAIGRAPVYGLTRNRSLDPHVHNESVTDKREEPQRKFASVNPDLHVIRVDTSDGRPLMASVIFSVHGTGISQHSHEYNADVWGYLADECATRIAHAHRGVRPVIGTIEGTHADVAPAIRPGLAGHLEAARIGRGIGARAAECFESLAGELRDDIDLAFGFTEIDLDRNRSIDNVTLPRRAAVGAALVAGAKENLTPVVASIPAFRAGMPKRWYARNNPQGPKWVLGSRWLQPLVVPPRGFPRVLPLQLLRLGTTTIVGLPFEITIESGRRIAAAVGMPDTIVSSVANEYSGYVTTPEEYARQYYEGGHTIYGPNTLPFLAAHVAQLARDVAARTYVSSPMSHRTFDVKVHRYTPKRTNAKSERRFVTDARYVDPTKIEDGYWEIEWVDVAPGDLHWHEPLVRVVDEAGELVADDAYGAIDVRYLGEGESAYRYRARWFDPMSRADRTHRFVLCANAGRPELASDPFD